MKRFTLIIVATILALAAVAVTALAMEAGPIDNSPMAPNQTNPRLAVAHLAPFAADPGTAVTVTLDGTPVLTDVEFADSTGYLDVPTGTYVVGIWPAGSASPAITGSVTFTEDMDYSAIAIGDGSNQPLDLLVLEDDNTPPDTGYAHVRIGHLAPFADVITDTWADVRLQDGTVLLDDVPFGAVAAYLPLTEGTYDLKITTADGSATLIDLMPVTFNDGDILSVFAVGEGVNQPLGAFVWPSGMAGALADLAANLGVAHLAPFADNIAGTAVTVTVDSTSVLTDFEFAESTGYLPLEAGVDHLIEVFPMGSADPAISATVNLTQAMDYSAIAIGDVSNQPLDLLLLEDDNTPPAAGNAHVRIGHLAPFADVITDTWADVRLQDGTVLLDDVPYGDVAPYLPLAAGTYDLKITTPDGSATLIDLMPVTLGDGDILSVFAVGEGVNQPLGAFAWPSGMAGALADLAANLGVAHLAPFADNIAGTAVTVTVDSTSVLTDFEFAESTGYLPLEAGVDHLVEIFPMGSADPAISATVNLTQAMDFSAIAIGDGSNQPLDLLLLKDDNSPATGTPGNAKVRIGHLAPFAATITDTVADVWVNGTVFLDDVLYGAVTGYTELVPADYELELTPGDGTLRVFGPADLLLEQGDIASVFAVGDNANQPVAMFVWPSGEPGFLLSDQQMIFLPLVVRNF